MCARLMTKTLGRENDCSVLVKVTLALKEALIVEARRRRSSLNDLAVGSLALRYGVPFTPSGRRGGEPSPAKLDVVLRLPRRLKYCIQLEALRAGSNTTDTIMRVLSEELGVGAARPEPRVRAPFGGGPRRQPSRSADRRASSVSRDPRDRLSGSANPRGPHATTRDKGSG